jgi:hypothetical protein
VRLWNRLAAARLSDLLSAQGRVEELPQSDYQAA